ncbi:MAG: DUF6617 family protein [Bacteroidales bacterium]|jgi:hypothetical protein|nr:DUF6617 family protein [Bacteroidales bacterium]
MLKFDRLDSAIQSIVDWAHELTRDINDVDDLLMNDIPDFPIVNYLGIEQEFINNTLKYKDAKKIEKEYKDRLIVFNKVDLSSYKEYFGSKEFKFNNIDEYLAVINYDSNDNTRDIHFEFYSQRIAGLIFEFDEFKKRIDSLIQNNLNNKLESKPEIQNQIKFKTSLSNEKFKYLYRLLTRELDFINESKTTEEDFLNVFTKKFNEHDSKIFLNAETTQFAAILKALKPFIEHFYKQIELSKKFITNEGNLLKAGNISSQLSKTKYTLVKEDEIIKKTIHKFLNQ